MKHFTKGEYLPRHQLYTIAKISRKINYRTPRKINRWSPGYTEQFGTKDATCKVTDTEVKLSTNIYVSFAEKHKHNLPTIPSTVTASVC